MHYEQYFDDYAELQEHDRDVHTYCTDSEAGLESVYHTCEKCGCAFDEEEELWDHAEEDHHVCRPCKEVSRAFRPSTTGQMKRRKCI
jgi:hypothetical protein